MAATQDSTPATIRRAEARDVSTIRDLTCQAYQKWVPVLGREPMPILADYDRALREHRIDLLFCSDDLVALIETKAEDDHLLIVNVAVLPAFQKRGYGRQMLAHAERLAATLGVRDVRLFTNKLFSVNIVLYTRLGYKIDREEPFRLGVAVHMSKRID
jgi:GNAT superfamily N-acetyltransferase